MRAQRFFWFLGALGCFASAFFRSPSDWGAVSFAALGGVLLGFVALWPEGDK